MSYSIKHSEADRNGVNIHRLVRLSYPAWERMEVILPRGIRHAIDTNWDIFPVKIRRAFGLGSGNFDQGLYRLSKPVMRGNPFRSNDKDKP